VSVKVTGLRQLRAAMKKAGDDLADFKDANAAVATLIASAASSAAPRRTGRLAASGRGNRAAGRAVVQFGGARLRYAGPIHWGWPARHIIARPFASDAAVSTQPRWLPIYEDTVAKIIDKITTGV
jgi:hypothetical protein